MIKKASEITLTVSKLGRAVNFYGNVMGLREIQASTSSVRFEAGGIDIVLSVDEKPERHRKGEPCIGFRVDDVDHAFNYLRERNVHFIDPPHDLPTGVRTTVFSDPDGNQLRLVSR